MFSQFLSQRLRRRPPEVWPAARECDIARRGPLMLRHAMPADALTVALLQRRDGRLLPKGERVVAQIGDEIVAAAHVPSGITVADPCVATAPVTAMLTFHARQLAREAQA